MKFLLNLDHIDSEQFNIGNPKFKVKMENSYIFVHDMDTSIKTVDVVSEVIGYNFKNVTIGFVYKRDFNMLKVDCIPVWDIHHATFREFRNHYLDLYLVFDSEKDYLKWKLKS